MIHDVVIWEIVLLVYFLLDWQYDVDLSGIQHNELPSANHISLNHDKIATMGLSLGAGYAISLAAHNHDIVNVVVAASGIASHFNASLIHTASGNSQFLCCDTNEGPALVAPRPLHITWNERKCCIFLGR